MSDPLKLRLTVQNNGACCVVLPESTASLKALLQTAAAQLYMCTRDSAKQVCCVYEAWWAELCLDVRPGDERWVCSCARLCCMRRAQVLRTSLPGVFLRENR